MRSETIRYAEVKHKASKRLPCSMCGTKVRRSATFSQTLSAETTREQITAELREQAAAWQQEAVMCTPCESLPLRSETYPAELQDVAEDRGDDTGPLATVDRIEAALGHLDADPNEPLIDPDCRDGKCGSCVGGLCEHECHNEEATNGE
jgi:hypothetical protein